MHSVGLFFPRIAPACIYTQPAAFDAGTRLCFFPFKCKGSTIYLVLQTTPITALHLEGGQLKALEGGQLKALEL